MTIWNFIRKKVNDSQKICLMVVIDSKGSSPGRRGFKMAVAEDGKMIGSVGGGFMEFNLVELAKEQLLQSDGIFVKHLNHNSEGKEDSSGMICSGSQMVAFYVLDRTYLPIITSISEAQNGSLEFNQDGIIFNRELTSKEEFSVSITDGKNWRFTEQLGFKNFLYIFGAGHVSVSVSMIFQQLGFYVTVFDNRDKNLTTYKSNTYANSKQIVDYKKVAKLVPEGNNIYVVIMTFAHKSDSKILKQLIVRNYKYLGMMGSEEKVASIYKKLESKGIDPSLFKNVDSPIGLPINSKTPMEIAVSIAAKIIQVKNT
jgi:xanthine dehydrogenase accessory factor